MKKIDLKIWNGTKMETLSIDNEFDCITGWLENSIIMLKTPFEIKNKPIYDGDILGELNDIDGKKEQSKSQVFFDDITGQWMLDESFKQDKTYCISLFHCLQEGNYEVVGNVYENKKQQKLF